MTAPTFRIMRVNADKPHIWATIVAMDAKCFENAATALVDNSGAWWIAYADGDVPAGYCGIKRSITGKNYGYLCRAGVLPKFRGYGLQKRLIRARVRYAHACNWEMVVTDTHENVPSANSLISCGFKLFEPEVKWSFPTAQYWRKILTYQ
jgi:ribosomal protein S18 acetylase RimI-like enzyme